MIHLSKWSFFLLFVCALGWNTPTLHAEPSHGSCPPLNEAGKRRTDAPGLALLAACINAQPDTKKLYFDASKKQYLPKRAALHQKIIDDFLGHAPCIGGQHPSATQQPIAIFTGGMPASGKTTFLKKHYPWLLSDQVVMINSDDIRDKLPEYVGWNAHNTYEEAHDISTRLLQKTISPHCRRHLVYDSTMSDLNKYNTLISALKKEHYRIFIVYLSVSPALSRERVLKRYQENGRYVPIDKIDTINRKSLAVFKKIAHEVDGYLMVNGENSTILKQKGALIPKWASQ